MKKDWDYNYRQEVLQKGRLIQELYQEAIAARLAKNPSQEFDNLEQYDKLLKEAKQDIAYAQERYDERVAEMQREALEVAYAQERQAAQTVQDGGEVQ